ncbi:MAG: AMIN-like domain-containing (lipo)protein [Intrasporangium sp.]|uniref:AMIN-like domain-containing (lipo)protein n=1 Tax=Intrasporangium sp. TaxID=1925024 RepID=UPI003F81B2C1
MKTNTRRRLCAIALAAALAAPVTAAATTNTASALPSCGTQWGSLAKTSASQTRASITGVRAGQHPCFDRLVFDLGRGTGKVGYDVRYVSTVTSPSSGLPVPVSGGARIQVTVKAPAAKRIPAGGTLTYAGWQSFRQLKWVTSFEGYTDFGLGVRARLPMRAFVLMAPDGGQRLVVDVAHHW